MRRARCLYQLFVAVLCLAATASAGMIDHDLTADGVTRTYSELVDAIPTSWDVYTNLTPLTEPSSMRFDHALPGHMDTAEGRSRSLGHVLKIGHPNGSSRPVWAIYDRLSRIDSPQVLWFHDGRPPATGPRPFDRAYAKLPYVSGAAGIRGSSGSSGSPRSAMLLAEPESASVIPEPVTAILLIGGAACLALRRGRR